MMKTGYTRRKFYGKWLYKVTFHVPGVSLFRIKTPTEVIEFCDNPYEAPSMSSSLKKKAHQEKNKIKRIAIFVDKLPADVWTKRIERDILDIYTNDVNLYNSAISECCDLICRTFEPDPSCIDALDIPSNIAVKKYPHNKYRHRVYLLPHKIDRDIQVRESYLNWVQAQPNILLSDAVKKWFINTHWNWDRRYILVEDSQTLLMLKLRNPDVIGRVYDYVLTDK